MSPPYFSLNLVMRFMGDCKNWIFEKAESKLMAVFEQVVCEKRVLDKFVGIFTT